MRTSATSFDARLIGVPPGMTRRLAATCACLLAVAVGCGVPVSAPPDSVPPTLGSGLDDGNPDGSTTVEPASSSEESASSISIRATPVFCCNPLSIDFAVVHSDPSDAIAVVRYNWDFGNGWKAAGAAVQHTYGRPGEYLVKVEAFYNDGTSESATTLLVLGQTDPPPPEDSTAAPDQATSNDSGGTVSPAATDSVESGDPTPVMPPVADAGPDQVVVEGDLVLLDAGGSRGFGTASPSYAWRQLSGPVVPLTGGNTARATFVAPTPTGSDGTSRLVFELAIRVGSQTLTDTTEVVVTAIPTAPASADPSLPSREQLTAWLAELPPLQKVHYSFPIQQTMLVEPVEPLLREYVRVSRAVSVSGESVKEQHLAAAVGLCVQANAGGGIPASIAVNYSPWHRVFPPDQPPTYNGPEAAAEIQTFRDRMFFVRNTLASINAVRRTQIAVTAVLLDSERFYVKPTEEAGAAEWNAAIDAKYAAIYNAAREAFPQARIEWYGRGLRESAGATGWSPFGWFTFNEPSDAFSCSLYRVAELTTMRETMRKTYEFAVGRGSTRVTPWVALASGYQRQVDQFQVWRMDWDYDPVYSLLLGREINIPWYGQNPDRFAPWGAADFVVFYPPPFDVRVPAWGKHFVAYARGAAGIDQLP